MAGQVKAVVAAKWLAEMVRSNRVGSSLRVLDASWYLPKMNRNAEAEFKRCHVPGASFFSIDECGDLTSHLDHMLPSEAHFSQYVSRLGIQNQTHVVVYDGSDVGSFSAPRVWWMFRLFGHQSVSVLDGGLKNWLREGHSVTDQHTTPETTHYTATINPDWVRTYQHVLDNLTSQDKVQLVDARAEGRFRGLEPEPRECTEPGHIPGSINMPFSRFVDCAGLEKPVEELREMFRQAGVDLTRPLWVTCGSGVTACHVALAAHLCGHPGVSLYDGAWAEWFSRASPEHVVSEGRGKQA